MRRKQMIFLIRENAWLSFIAHSETCDECRALVPFLGSLDESQAPMKNQKSKGMRWLVVPADIIDGRTEHQMLSLFTLRGRS